MTTLAQAVTKIVNDSIDHDYLADCEATLKEVYMSEYGSWRMETSPKTCMDYLQGLPSVCTIPFNNHEILELLTAQGIARKTEAAKDRLIDDYWLTAGRCFHQLVK